MSQNGSGQDPWGKPGQNNEQKPENSSNNGWNSNQNRGNQEQSPPDIEEIFSNLLKKLGRGGKNGGRNNASSNPSPLMPSVTGCYCAWCDCLGRERFLHN